MRYFGYAFVSIFIFAGVVIAAFGAVVLYRCQRSAGWPRTDGVTTRAEVVISNNVYSPAVVYSYNVGGVEYQGTGIGPQGTEVGSSDGAIARELVHRYRAGTSVVVYYDPSDPAVAVLEPGITKKSFVLLAFGVGFAIFAAWFGLLLWLIVG